MEASEVLVTTKLKIIINSLEQKMPILISSRTFKEETHLQPT